MNIPSIDQVLAIAAPTSNTLEPSRSDAPDEGRFQGHLQRAGESEKSRPESSDNLSGTPASETRTHEKDTEGESSQTTDDRYETTEPDPASKPEAEAVEAAVEEQETTGDEVEVSEAALAAADAQPLNQQIVEQTIDLAPQPQQGNAEAAQAPSGQSAQSEGEEPVLLPFETEIVEKPAAEGEVPTESQPVVPTGEGADSGEKGSPEEVAVPETGDAKILLTAAAQNGAAGDSAVQIDSAKRLEASRTRTKVTTAESPERQAVAGGERAPTGIQEGSQESVALSQAPQVQAETETVNRPHLAAREAVSETGASSTLGEAQVLDRLSAEGKESAAVANSSEGDSAQKQAPATPLRSLEQVLGSRSVRSGSSETQADNTVSVDRIRFVQRVGNAIRSAQQNNGQIQLRLSPPELGSLKIEISVQQGALTAKLETETVAARTLLLDNLPALRERLAEQNIRIEQFDVDVRDEGRQPAEDRSTDNSRSDNSPGDAQSQDGSKSSSEETEDQAVPAGGIPAAVTSEGLDVSI